jgi:hypothetical protein
MECLAKIAVGKRLTIRIISQWLVDGMSALAIFTLCRIAQGINQKTPKEKLT